MYIVLVCKKKKNSIKPKFKAMVTLGFRRMGDATKEEHTEDTKGMGKFYFLIWLKGIQVCVSLVYKIFMCTSVFTVIIIKNRIKLVILRQSA